MYNYLFTTCITPIDFSSVQTALTQAGISFTIEDVIETSANGDAKRVYNVYIDEKDLNLANDAMKKHKDKIWQESLKSVQQNREREEQMRKERRKERIVDFFKNLGNIALAIIFFGFLAMLCSNTKGDKIPHLQDNTSITISSSPQWPMSGTAQEIEMKADTTASHHGCQ